MSESTDQLEILLMLNTYGVSIDARDWQLFRTIFHEDVVADYGKHGKWEGREVWAEFFDAFHVRWAATQHVITNHHIQLAGDDATARSYIQATLVVPGTEGGDTVLIRGYYDDALVRTADGWKIIRREFHPLWYEGNLTIVGYQPGETPRSEPPWTLASAS